MAESEERKGIGWLGCLLRLIVVGMVLVVLGCSGSIAGAYFAFFNGIYTPVEASQRALAVRGGTLYDGTDAKPREGITVVIEKGEITCAKRGCGVPVGATVVDAKGHAVIPGLTDLHIHFGAPVAADLNGNPAATVWRYLRHRPDVRRSLIASGVTTIRSVGDDANNLPNTRAWLADGTLAGPRIYGVGPIFTAPGGHPAGTIYRDQPYLVSAGTRQVDDSDAARAEVKALIEAGFDGIKLVYDDGGGNTPKLEKMVMQAVVSEAVYHKVWVAAHTGTDQDIAEVVTAGVTSVEHGSHRESLTEPTIALLAKKGVVYVPTLAVVEALAPDDLALASANAKAAFDGGVAIGVGSDTQGAKMSFGPSTHREIELLMKAGIPGVHALRGATGVAASALGKSSELGTLVPGRKGDLVIVGESPWDDASALSEVRVVVQNGQVVYDAR